MNWKEGFRRIALVSAILVAVIACACFLAVIIPFCIKVVLTTRTFTISDYIVVDDFESYNELDPADPNSNRIFIVWIDGYGRYGYGDGALVGYENLPFLEQTIVHGGKQSMPLVYSNTGGATYSEAERTFAATQNWTQAGSAKLVLYFHGTEVNTGQLYVKVNDSKVVYDGDAGDIAKPQWNQWNIDLASLGVDLQNVTKLSIGIDGNGASGKLYFDDIRVYRSALEASRLGQDRKGRK